MDDEAAMGRALELSASVRTTAHPNPWVGAVLVAGGDVFEGATEPPGARHAEAVALDAAGPAAEGASLFVTLEPCVDWDGKRTPSCAGRIAAAGVRRVVVALEDPDPRVRGRGVAALRAAGLDVDVGLLAGPVAKGLEAYVHHRTTGRPYVVLKLAASLDGRTAAPDGTSQWITGAEARADAHRLRAESDVIVVGAGTVRADDPALTVRLASGPEPRRIVLGSAAPHARVQPCEEHHGPLGALLDRLGGEGVVQVMVEGGATVAGHMHRHGLVDRYVVYLAPVLFGGDDAAGLFRGPGAPTMEDVFRGRFAELTPLGDDLRVDLVRRG